MTVALLVLVLLALAFAAWRWMRVAERRQKRVQRKIRQQEEQAAWERMLEQRRYDSGKGSSGVETNST